MTSPVTVPLVLSSPEFREEVKKTKSPCHSTEHVELRLCLGFMAAVPSPFVFSCAVMAFVTPVDFIQIAHLLHHFIYVNC